MSTLTIEGIVEKVTFYNAENGYAVFTVTEIKDSATSDDTINTFNAIKYPPFIPI